jgi:superfamily II DNA or RNA helicase
VGTHIASDLNAKTLVIAHKVELLDQWEEAAKQFFGVECGRIQGPRWDYDYPITVATIQTLAANLDRLPEITGQFGLTIIDEAHKFSCASFHNVVPFLDSKYRLGVSATFRRADKLEGVWEHHLGKVTVQAKRSKTAADYKSPAIELEIDPNLYLVRGDISHSKLLTVLSEIPDYNKWAAEVIQTCFNRGRKILTISHRKSQCFEINTLLTQMGVSSKVYVGKTTAADLQAAKDCGIILATDKKFSEGIDAPELDTLLLLTPFSDPEQIVGRIGRSQKNVNRALVIDPRINHPYLESLYRKRVRVYERLGITNATDE